MTAADDHTSEGSNSDFPSVRKAFETNRSTSRDSSEWISTGDFIQWQNGDATPEKILRDELRRRKTNPPTNDEIDRFSASLEDQQRHLTETMRQTVNRLMPTVKLAESVGVKVDLPPLFEPITPLNIPLPAAAPRAADAVEAMRVEMVAQQKLMNDILSKMVADARDATKTQTRLGRKTLWVSGATLLVAIISVVVAIVIAG